MSLADAEFEDWVHRAKSRDVLEVAISFGARLRRVGSEHAGPCLYCKGVDRFSVAPSKSAWNCRGFGGGYGPISMLQHIAGLSFLEACEQLTGDPPPRGEAKPISAEERAAREHRRKQNEDAQRVREQQEQRRREERADTAASIWTQVRPIAGTPAEAYLHGRGVPTPFTAWPDCLGYHPGLRHEFADQVFPCLVGRVDDVCGKISAVWRIFIIASGKKAPVENPKLGLGPAMGGAVRIGGIGKHIGIAEGIESALGAWFLIGQKYPVWSGLSANGIAGVELPLIVERVTVFPDGDHMVKRQGNEFVPEPNPAGIRSARDLRARLVPAGIRCVIAEIPKQGMDYLDVWNSVRGEAA